MYSTPKHPLALVFEFMDYLNLRISGGVNLYVFIFISAVHHTNVSKLAILEIARGLEYMHNLDVVHGNLKIVCHFLQPHSSCMLAFVQETSTRRVADIGVTFLQSPGSSAAPLRSVPGGGSRARVSHGGPTQPNGLSGFRWASFVLR